MMVTSLSLIACGGGSHDHDSHGEFESIKITSYHQAIVANTSQNLVVIGSFDDGHTEVVKELTWKSSNPEVATIDDNGTFSALSKGETEIYATHDDLTTEKLTIFVISAPITDLSLTMEKSALYVGSKSKYFAIAKVSDTEEVDVSLTSVYSSSDNSVATIEGNVATGVAVGDVSFSATFTDATGNKFTATPFQISVSIAQLMDIKISASVETLAVGSSSQFVATAIFQDEKTEDVSSRATWRSSDTNVVTVSDSGVVKAIAAGTATITASDADDNFDDEVTVTVQ
ncbi:Ig-like domain-containing protein [Parashewanella tropica]|uniref:Ig-like domain-containing protein n=1 Tax=Parashewanella tropica TaxID=2547970 RepID=UPI00105A22AA|nr:Ig-like domain-containing protein [Parashewanella tropica]